MKHYDVILHKVHGKRNIKLTLHTVSSSQLNLMLSYAATWKLVSVFSLGVESLAVCHVLGMEAMRRLP